MCSIRGHAPGKLVWLNIPRKDAGNIITFFVNHSYSRSQNCFYKMHSNHSLPHPSLAGPGSRVQVNKNDLSRSARRQKVLVSKLKPTLIMNKSRLNHPSPLACPLAEWCWWWPLWSGALGSSGHGYSAPWCLGRHRNLPKQMMMVIYWDN